MGAPNDVRQQPVRHYRPGYEVVAERLLEVIADSNLAAGAKLGTEAQLAERLGVSRTVLREAVKLLTAVGRVTAKKGSGLYVARQDGFSGFAGLDAFLPADLDELTMLFEYRKVQEQAAARLAAWRATPAELREIQQTAEATSRAAEAPHVTAFHEGDTAFHAAIASAAHNRLLDASVALARKLLIQSFVIALGRMLAGSPNQAAEEHLAIAAAIGDGSAELADELMGAHLDRALQDYRQEIRRRLLTAGRRR